MRNKKYTNLYIGGFTTQILQAIPYAFGVCTAPTLSAGILSASRQHRSCVFYLKCYEFICAPTLLCLENIVFLCASIASDTYTLPETTSSIISDCWEEGVGSCIPFRAEHSEVSYNMCLGHQCLSVLTMILLKQKLPL